MTDPLTYAGVALSLAAAAARGLLDSGARDAEHGGVEGVAGGVARGAAVAVLLASLRALGHYSRGS